MCCVIILFCLQQPIEIGLWSLTVSLQKESGMFDVVVAAVRASTAKLWHQIIITLLNSYTYTSALVSGAFVDASRAFLSGK